jgi:hypothetical protein
MSRLVYNDDPTFVTRPFSVSEVEALINCPKSVSKSDISHLLERLLATVKQVKELRINHDKELRRRGENDITDRLTKTASPEHAIRYLTTDQIDKIFDSRRQQQLAASTALRERMEQELDQVRSGVTAAIALLTTAQDTIEPGSPTSVMLADIASLLQTTKTDIATFSINSPVTNQSTIQD